MPHMTPAEAEAIFQRQPVLMGRTAFFRLLADLGFEGMGQGVPPTKASGKPRKQRVVAQFHNIYVPPGTLLRKVLQMAGMVESQKEAKRLIEQGGVTLNENWVIHNTELVFDAPGIYRAKIGGKRVLEIEVMEGEQ